VDVRRAPFSESSRTMVYQLQVPRRSTSSHAVALD
jgi:hypothetical protein